MGDHDAHDVARLGRWLEQVRHHHGLRQADFAAVLGMSTRNYQAIVHGRRDDLRVGTIRAVERALELAPGTVDRLMAGDGSVPIPQHVGDSDGDTAAAGAQVSERLTRLEAQVDTLMRLLADRRDAQ